MSSESAALRLSLGHLLARALATTRARWPTLLILLVSLDWAPRTLMYLSGIHRYDPSSHDAAAFAAFASQSATLALASLMMQATAIPVGLADKPPFRSASAAIGQVLARLPVLSPFWLLAGLPTAATLWIEWASTSYADIGAMTLWRQVASTVFVISVDTAVGLYSIVGLSEGLPVVETLRRTLRLMAKRRGAVFIVAFATDIIGLLINLLTPFLTVAALNSGLGHLGWVLAVATSSFVWETAAVISTLVFVELYRELARAHDGVAPGELSHIFA